MQEDGNETTVTQKIKLSLNPTPRPHPPTTHPGFEIPKEASEIEQASLTAPCRLLLLSRDGDDGLMVVVLRGALKYYYCACRVEDDDQTRLLPP